MATLITGATGYLGRRIAAALPGEELVLGVRARDAADLARQRDRLGPELATAGRVSVVPLNLPDAAGLAQLDPRRVTRIVHAAAVTRFSVDRATAAEVNVAGTRRLRRYAGDCSRLERFVLLSTLYTSGRRHGEVPEIRHDDAGFVNHYEWSKWAAEEELLADPALPVTVVRLPTVIADDGSGAVGQHNAVHHTLKLYYYGLLSLLPGDPVTPLSLATAAFATDAVTTLLDAAPGIYHACPGPVSLGEAVAAAFTAFDADPAFQRRMLPRPVPCDRDSFRDLVTAAERLRGGPIHAALASVAPFAEQLYLPKVFGTERLRAAWPGYRAGGAAALVQCVAAHLVATRWGRQPVRPPRSTHVPV